MEGEVVQLVQLNLVPPLLELDPEGNLRPGPLPVLAGERSEPGLAAALLQERRRGAGGVAQQRPPLLHCQACLLQGRPAPDGPALVLQARRTRVTWLTAAWRHQKASRGAAGLGDLSKGL